MTDTMKYQKKKKNNDARPSVPSSPTGTTETRTPYYGENFHVALVDYFGIGPTYYSDRFYDDEDDGPPRDYGDL